MKRVWETVKCQGKIREKSRNFEVEDKWQPCKMIVFVTALVHPGETPSSSVCQGQCLRFPRLLCIIGQIIAGPCSAIGRAADSYARGPGFDTQSGNLLSFLLPLFQEGQLSVTGESMCTKYWLTA